MGRLTSDPNTRRLRRFVVLVIFAVTLPSLLLSGFGLIAIDNERDAARQRVYELYEPVVRKLSLRLKERLRRITEASALPLQLLARWAQGRGTAPREALARLQRRHPVLANTFVLAADGTLLRPARRPPPPGRDGPWPEALREARQLEFRRAQPLSAATIYRSLLGGADGQTARCQMLRAIQQGLGRPAPLADDPCQPRSGGAADPHLRCMARNGLARSLDRAGRSLEAAAAWERLADGCPRFVHPSGALLALAARLRRLELLWPQDRVPALAAGEALAAALRDPLLPAAVAQKRFVAARAAALLAGAEDSRVRALRGLFERVASGARLLAAAAELDAVGPGPPQLRSVPLDGGRRMLVVGRFDGLLAGAELVPSLLEPELQALVAEMELGPGAVVRLQSATQPHRQQETGLLAGSSLLAEGQFAWRLDLSLAKGDALEQLTRTRARTYQWLLALLVLVLVAGISGTVWVMVRETRLSRLKTDFVSSVSHELRTPLTSIRLFTETLLLDRAGSEAERREFLEIISRESERLSRLVERILDFSRMEAGRRAYAPRPTDVAELVEASTAACRSLLEERRTELEVQLEPDLPPLPAERDALIEVLINLLANAVKYSPVGSPVTIAARRRGDELLLAVRDRGIGIPRAEQARIFDKFYRVETPLTAEVSGSGLGLSLVRYIVEGHAGRVEVDSAPGRGSTFTIHLPLGEALRGEP